MTRNKLWLAVFTGTGLTLLGCKKESGGSAPESDQLGEVSPEASNGSDDDSGSGSSTQQNNRSNTNILTTNASSTNSNTIGTAGSLSLALVPPTPANLSFRPANESQSGLGLTQLASDLAEHEEQKFTWDPSQVPLKSMNKVLCVMAQTSYQNFVGEGNYTAKIKIDECFNRGELGGSTQDSQSSSASKPADVVVNSAKDGEATVVKVWFSRELSMQDANSWMFMDKPGSLGGESNGTSGSASTATFNYYVTMRVFKSIKDLPPYGHFNLTYQVIPAYNGTENPSRGGIKGYVDIVPNIENGKVDVRYNERTNANETFSYFDGTQNVDSTALNIQEQKAFASLGLNAEKQVSTGSAVTATQWSQEVTSGTYSGSYSDQSGQYFMAFDKDNGSSDSAAAAKGRAIIDWDPTDSQANWWSSYAFSGYDPTAPRCEEMGTERPNTFSYTPYDKDGNIIVHMTSFLLEKEGSQNFDGCWVSGEWGSSCWGDIRTGDRLSARDAGGNNVYFTARILPGQLIDQATWKDITSSQTSNLTLTCSSMCPEPDISSSDLSQQWTSGSAMYLDTTGGSVTYSFDATTKELKYNGQAVRLAADAQWAWVSISLTGADSKSYMYTLSSYSKPVEITKEGESQPYTPPKPLKFRDEVFEVAKHARSGSVYSAGMVNLRDAAAKWSGVNALQLDNGMINVDWFQATDRMNVSFNDSSGTLSISTSWNDPGLKVGDVVRFSTDSGSTLPLGLASNTDYYVFSVAGAESYNHSFTVGTVNPTLAGNEAAIAIQYQDAGSGSGPHMVHFPGRKSVIDQWGMAAYMPKLTLKPGVVLKLDGDPDGAGPRFDGEEITIMPQFSEMRAVVRAGSDFDCAQSLSNAIADAKLNMSTPSALSSSDFDSRLARTSKPAGTFPIRSIDGTPIMDEPTQTVLRMR